MARFRLPQSVQELAEWYMRYISPLSLVGGIVVDNLFLARRVDLLLTNALLLAYLMVAAAAIIAIHMIQTGRLRHPWATAAFPLLPVAVQFAFGGLFSAYFSLYSRSADFALSWVFVVLVVVLILGNERFAHFYARYTVQLGIYFFVLFSFLTFSLPVLFHKIGPLMFALSGACALLAITLFLYALERLVPDVAARERTRVARTVAVMFLFFNALYFSNAIPPLPLALKDSGVYHHVSRQAGSYLLEGEVHPWYEYLFTYHTDLHLAAGERAYVFTSVFAPSGLSITVLHEWQHFDSRARAWVTVARVAFPIVGGRDGGYRGYSLASDPAPGLWRVNVLTAYGQIIGRVTFTVLLATSTPPLTSATE